MPVFCDSRPTRLWKVHKTNRVALVPVLLWTVELIWPEQNRRASKTMKILKTVSVGIMVLSACHTLFAQQPSAKPQASSKYRTIFALVGGGGGFALGFFTGLSVFDDSINSDRKIWTTAALSGVGGAVGGYFLG